MVMRDYGCEPELGLRLGSSPSPTDSSSSDNSIKSNRVEQYRRQNTTQHQQQHLQHKQQQQQQQQQITIFYNGRMSTCDVTEIQARAIICMARREMEKRTEKSNHHQHDDDDDQEQRTQQPNSSLPRPALAPQLINPVLPMKRSLQRFLQKRKTRMHAYTPYTYAAETPSPSSSCS